MNGTESMDFDQKPAVGRQSGREERSLGFLFRELSREVIDLVRQEVDFAKADLSKKADRTGKDVAFLAVGGAVSFAGLLALMGSLILALARVMPLGWSAFLVGLVVGGIGFLLLLSGRKRLKEEGIMPRRTIEALKEDGEWLKKRMT